jgi:MFS family permease
MSAAYSLGAIVALPFVPTVTDRFGRRNAIIFGSIIMVIGAALQTASQNCGLFRHFGDDGLMIFLLVAMFVIARLILGVGIVFAIVAASSLIGGLCSREHLDIRYL